MVNSTSYLKQSIVAENDRSIFCIVRGRVLVYLTCTHSGIMRRRLYLGTLTEGDVIPSVCYMDCDHYIWQLIITPLDEVEISTSRAGEYQEACDSFATRIGLKSYEQLGIEEALAESYRLSLVKDDAFIYQTEKDEKAAYTEGLETIRSVFKKGKILEEEMTSNVLYNAMVLLCKKQRIPIARYSEVCAISEAPSVEDIARISNFIVRKVTLDDNWWEKDVGCFLTFTRDDRTPIAITSNGYKRYYLHAMGCAPVPVSSKNIEDLSVDGYMLYRPLPEKKLKLWDVAKYILLTLRYRDFLSYLLMMLLGTIIGLLLPEMNRMLYDHYIPTGNTNGLLQIGGMILAFSLGNIMFSITGSLSSFRFATYPKYSLEAALYHRLLNLPQKTLNEFDSGDLASRVMGLGEVCCSLVNSSISTSLSVLMSFLYLSRMVSYSGELTWVSMLLLGVYACITLLLTLIQIRYVEHELVLRSVINSNLYQCLGGIAKIRMSGATTNALLRHMQRYAKYRKFDHKGNKVALCISTFSNLLSSSISIVLYLVVIQRIDTISSGTFMAFNSAFGSFSGAVLGATGLLSSFLQTRPFLQRASFLLNGIPESSMSKELPGILQGDIELSNVAFSYNESEGMVINNLSIHVHAGEYIGIVGASGCGKSTLLKLLLGFETPSLGKIYFDGKDISTIDKRELRKQIGVVLQNGSLITGSIQENITITSPHTTRERVNEVIREVGLENDIDMMPMGIHTMLSADGEMISGGQKQRILIARALAGKPAILMFDEATSALDNLTQNIVTNTLAELNTTRIVIAHRLSTVQKCDRILVMEKGSIIEEGSYEDLLARKGAFWEMATRQIA